MKCAELPFNEITKRGDTKIYKKSEKNRQRPNRCTAGEKGIRQNSRIQNKSNTMEKG